MKLANKSVRKDIKTEKLITFLIVSGMFNFLIRETKRREIT